jgi:hypothetical protein
MINSWDTNRQRSAKGIPYTMDLRLLVYRVRSYNATPLKKVISNHGSYLCEIIQYCFRIQGQLDAQCLRCIVYLSRMLRYLAATENRRP